MSWAARSSWSKLELELASQSAVNKASQSREEIMGRAILLLLLGVPIPIIILLALIWH
jgi:hypothetical protein